MENQRTGACDKLEFQLLLVAFLSTNCRPCAVKTAVEKEEKKNELWSDFTKPPVSPVSSTSIDLSCDLHLFRISVGEHVFLEDMLLAMFFFFLVLLRIRLPLFIPKWGNLHCHRPVVSKLF